MDRNMWVTLSAVVVVLSILSFAFQEWLLGTIIIILYLLCFLVDYLYHLVIKLWRLYQNERSKLS